MAIKLSKLPVFRQGQWAKSNGSLLISAVREFVWCLRLFSLASWLSPFFQKKEENSFYSEKNFTDYYLLLCLMFTVLLIVGTGFGLINSIFAAVWAVITILDGIQYQLRLVLLRPIFHKNYSPYSAERTLIILLLLYIQAVGCFSLLYLHAFECDFTITLDVGKAVEFSIVTITTLGYGNVTAEPGSGGAIVSALEALCGVFFLGLIISTAIGRQKSILALDSVTRRLPLQDQCLHFLSSHGYATELQKLSDALEGDLWIVGGWVRNSALNIEYCGDIDCLTTLESRDLEDRLANAGYKPVLNRFGTYRIFLLDGNHVDLTTTIAQASTTDIVKAIRAFNFTVNSAAINYSTGRLVCSEKFIGDIKNREFHITCSAELRDGEYWLGFIRDMETLENYYGLNPVNDEIYQKSKQKSQKLINDFYNISFDEAMEAASERLKDIIPSKREAWVVRGYVRCAYLGELKYWDDLDVIVDCSSQELISHLDQLGVSWAKNYFGNPKIYHSSGITIDIWPLTQGQSIENAISEFPHDIDSLAWPVNGGGLIASDRTLNSISNRKLCINHLAVDNLSKRDVSYTAIKAVYLIIRHNLEPDSSVAQLLNRDFEVSPLIKKHTISLAKELRISGINDIFDVTEYIKKICDTNEPTSLLMKYWDVFIHEEKF